MNSKIESLKHKIEVYKAKIKLLDSWESQRTDKAIDKVKRYRATRERNYNQVIERCEEQIKLLQTPVAEPIHDESQS